MGELSWCPGFVIRIGNGAFGLHLVKSGPELPGKVRCFCWVACGEVAGFGGIILEMVEFESIGDEADQLPVSLTNCAYWSGRGIVVRVVPDERAGGPFGIGLAQEGEEASAVGKVVVIALVGPVRNGAKGG